MDENLMFTKKTEAASTYITLWPAGAMRPTASNLNIFPGQIRPHLVISKVGTGGCVDFYNNAGISDIVVDVVVDIVVDIVGWYS